MLSDESCNKVVAGCWQGGGVISGGGGRVMVFVIEITGAASKMLSDGRMRACME
jgi:hypothetical protein